MAGRTERHQAVEIEVRAPLGALDDVVEVRGDPNYAAWITGTHTKVVRENSDRRHLAQFFLRIRPWSVLGDADPCELGSSDFDSSSGRKYGGVTASVGALGLDSGKHFRRTVPSFACPTERLGE
jgi:hypothetical protein